MRIICKDLTYSYDPKKKPAVYALNKVSLTINEGEFFGIIGQTGSGKSTLIQHLNALLPVQEGFLSVGDLVSNFCNPISANELAIELGLSSVNTTKKFMDYLHEPYLFYYLPRYNNKLKLMKKAPRKVYVVDNGFVAAKAFSLSDNLGRLLENQVFIELMRRGYNVDKNLFYYRSRNNKETDFVLRHGTHIERLIQVCYDMSNPKTERREVDSLIECAEELKCNNLVIVTNNDTRIIEKNGYKISVVPIASF